MPTSIIEEPLYTEQINSLRIDWKRLDEAFLELQNAILLVPDVFPLVPGTKLRRVQLVGFPGVPPLSIFFAVVGDTAHLVAAELISGED
ncbi:MAG: hypothetical protein ACLQHF_09645 [Terracidiphilus sp.]